MTLASVTFFWILFALVWAVAGAVVAALPDRRPIVETGPNSPSLKEIKKAMR